MIRRYNRLLVVLFVVSDTLLGMTAFLVAYLLRFETLAGLLPVHKGFPPFAQYLRIAPFIGALVPVAFQVQGLYRLRRGPPRVVGFLDDRAGGDHIGYRGIPLLGTLAEADDIVRRENVDHLYVALPLEEHVKMLALIEATNREGIDIHVVPDLLQFIALRARLENLDGVPIISLNDVPLRGFNSVLKRAIDAIISSGALACLSVPFAIVAWLIKRESPGPVFYTQERMGL